MNHCKWRQFLRNELHIDDNTDNQVCNYWVTHSCDWWLVLAATLMTTVSTDGPDLVKHFSTSCLWSFVPLCSCTSLFPRLLAPLSRGHDSLFSCVNPFVSLWRLLVVSRTCLALRWLHPWTPASWDRPARPTADPLRAGLPAPPLPSGARAQGGGLAFHRRATGRPSWRARSRREDILYLHLSLKKIQYLRNPLKSRDSQGMEPKWGVGSTQ